VVRGDISPEVKRCVGWEARMMVERSLRSTGVRRLKGCYPSGVVRMSHHLFIHSFF
jgi:hypothetical protein